MKCEFKRDLQHNYLMIEDDNMMNSTYKEKMIKYNKVEGIIPFHSEQMNQNRRLCYEIHGEQPLSEVCSKYPPGIQELSNIITGLFQIIERVSQYLLSEDDFFLSVDHMFIKLPDYALRICYYPGYKHSIRKQLSDFFEKLMTYINYEDKDAVYTMYSLYMKSKEGNCTIEQLKKGFDSVEVSTKSNDKLVSAKPEEKVDSIRESTQLFQIDHHNTKEKGIHNNIEYPKAMEACFIPPNEVQEQRTEMAKDDKVVTSRQLVANQREQEQEIIYYPSKCYIYAAALVFGVITVGTLLFCTNILYKVGSNQLDPIKTVAFGILMVVPCIYGFLKIFQPKNKISKTISLGYYEPPISHEMAAALEQEEKEIESQKSIMIKDKSGIGEGEKTILLNGVTGSLFPQLSPCNDNEANLITITECPYFIGTVKNRLNYSIQNPIISRYHAKIELVEETYFLTDLNSTNGTYLNGKKLRPNEPTVLVPGDKVTFANISFNYTCPRLDDEL